MEEQFKDKLRRLRTEAGLSQEALSDAVHISRSAIAKYENGLGKPSEDTLQAIAFYFGVPVNDLRDKAQKRRISIKKIGIIAACAVFGIGILSGAGAGLYYLFRPSNSQIGSDGPIGGDIPSVVGFYLSPSIKDLPDKLPKSSDGEYYATTFLDYNVAVCPETTGGSVDVAFDGDIAVIDAPEGASVYFNGSGETSYTVSFSEEGKYEISFSVSGEVKTLTFIVDDDAKAYGSFYVPMKDAYRWIDGIHDDPIAEVRVEEFNGSVGPNQFKRIYDSSDSEDIEDAWSFLHQTMVKTNQGMRTGGYSRTLTITTSSGERHSISTYDGLIAKTSFSYILSIDVPNLISPSLAANAFVAYGSDDIVAYAPDGERIGQFDSLFSLEFVQSDFEPAQDPIVISGYIGGLIEVYDQTHFGYLGNCYETVGDADFSALLS